MNPIRFLQAAVIALLLTGCGNDETDTPDRAGTPEPSSPPGASAPTTDDALNPLLDRVSADTAYLFANLERLPDAVSAKAWEINELNAQQQTSLLLDLADDEELPPAMRVLFERISTLSSREGWMAAGLHPNPFLAVHTVDMLPALELELSDGVAFDAFVAGIEVELEQPLVRRDVDGREVIWIELRPGFGLGLTHDGSTLSAALTFDDAASLARLTGRTGPVEALGSDGLQAFNREAALGPNGSGFIDIRRLTAGLLDADSSLMKLADEGEKARFREVIENPACVAEYTAVANALPRSVFGYTRLDAERMDMLFRQELTADLATALQALAAAPVALERDLNGLFHLGLAVDLIAAREFARGLVAGWAENPPTCPSFATIAAGAPAWQQTLSQPVPPVVTNLHGLFLEANTLELGDGPVPVGGGTLALYMRQPEVLVGMAQMFAPAVAAMDLRPGGDPVRVPDELAAGLGQTGLEFWMAMAESALGLAVGEEQVPALQGSLAKTTVDDNLLAGRMDISLLPQLIDFARGTIADIEDDEMAAALEVQRAQYVALAEVYDRSSFQLKLTERGIELLSQTTFKQ
ncbi:MAG: hypothetical protein RQ729_05505 [Wenzhouxiangellaceae bacterium]|nr:hypothetical protein [Wenzhouxiangellaceae bacterium]